MYGSGRRFGWCGLGLVFAVAACFSESDIGDGDPVTASATDGADTVSPGTGGMTMVDGPSTLDAGEGSAITGEGTGSSASMSATVGDVTSGPEPMTSGAGPTTDPTATGPADTGSMTATDDSAGTCAGDCVACLECARDPSGPCGNDNADCLMDQFCSPAINQLQYCESQPDEQMCCPPMPGNEAGEKLWACLMVECGAVCHCLMGG